MSSIAKEEHYDRYVGRIARGASISAVSTAIATGMRFVTQIALARMYGPAQLGIFTLGATIWTVTIMLSEFGMNQAVVRYVAEHRPEGTLLEYEEL